MDKILIIDDEAPIRKMLKILFEKNGYDVMEARDGVQAVKVFKELGADLIITDLIMPEKEGLETIKEIRKLNPDAKIIAISGGGLVNPEMYLGLAKKLGAHCSFSKPLDNKALLLTVKNLLAQ
ncbi:MAG: response regulator [Proteobacteria bacterium]|nr:response regulator [Pseudomonadota bacterium]MBU1581287.1 response regulator [Pseudomonadota bacterium]MBU2627041.1 response regulator [Pseudomonadota bacterium]